uniref:Uncharacterized protein n=1 Tax=Physcomitrium patens TaxID=3218 RepID=A0A2K1IND0_PHYPA|nr:hypothetical protein PHYPA_027102 [Physcomitrium patens]
MENKIIASFYDKEVLFKAYGLSDNMH